MNRYSSLSESQWVDRSIDRREFGWTGVKVSDIGMGTYYGHSYEIMAPLFRLQGGWDKKIAALKEGLSLLRQQGGWHKKIAALNKALTLLRQQGSMSEKIEALKKGLELGINLIDTAEIYQTEDIVAEAIKGHERGDLFIATKVPGNNLRYDDVLKAAENSLNRLECSYIDLYQIHWPNSRVPIEETMKAMEKLVDDGKVRYLGVSNFSLEQMRRAEEALSKNKLASNQVEYNLMVRGIEKDLLPYCEQKGIVILPYRPIAQGTLANPNERLKAVMDEISQKHGGKTPAQIALNWLMTKSNVIFPIPRASRPERVIENVGSVGWSLGIEDMRKLEECAHLSMQVAQNRKKGNHR
ncbi:MAG: aldo/keto reductase [Candidatus Bathyarchaeia archaeon]